MRKIQFLFVILLTHSTIILASKVSQPNTTNSQCPEKDKCRPREVKNIPPCYCDQTCYYYKDCCKEYVSEHQRNIEIKTMKKHSCIPLTTEKFVFAERIGAFMIDICLYTNNTCKATDEDPKGMLPVSTANATYMNAKCATCNGVSDFYYWTAIYEIYDEQGFENFNERNSSMSNEGDTLNYIRNENPDAIVRTMHPPANTKLRFCPLYSQHDENGIQFGLYQHPVYCKSILYKNIDMCNRDGCCMFSKYRECIQFFLRLYHKNDDAARTGIDSLQIMLAMDGKDEMGSSSLAVARKSFTLKYKYNKIQLFVEMESQKNETVIDYDACVQVLMLYLHHTVYKLYSLKEAYNIKKLPSGRQVLLLLFRSYASLSLDQINNLHRLEIGFKCEDKKDNTVVNGKLRKANATDQSAFWDGTIDTKMQKLIRLNKYDLVNRTLSNDCDNLSLMLGGTNEYRIIVHVECEDDNNLQTAQNLATRQTTYLLNILVASLCLTITLIYI